MIQSLANNEIELFGIITKQQMEFNKLSRLQYPIVINWCITGKCFNKCIYCYGNNIRDIVMNEEKTNEICCNILKLQPENVILTGGEPLLNINIDNIIRNISEKANVIVDTNGIEISGRNIHLFKERKVKLRISLDSINYQVNEYIRPSSYCNSTKLVINHIKYYVDVGFHVIIQTVLTRFNENELIKLAEFLVSVGIKEWRIQKVLTDNERLQPFSKKEKIKIILSKYPINIQYVNYLESDPSGIILVEPNGLFFTKKKNGERILINEKKPDNPSLCDVLSKINHQSHYNRYLLIN